MKLTSKKLAILLDISEGPLDNKSNSVPNHEEDDTFSEFEDLSQMDSSFLKRTNQTMAFKIFFLLFDVGSWFAV